MDSRIWYIDPQPEWSWFMPTQEPQRITFDDASRTAFPLILTLDTHGVPHRWITWQHACYYYSKNQVAWTLGEHAFTVFGGMNRMTGRRSEITASSIIAVKGK